MKENIEANKEKGILSKTLATILLIALWFWRKDYELSTQMSKNRCPFLMS
jgi:DNA polymerase-1